MSVEYPDWGGVASVNAPVNIMNNSGATVPAGGSVTLGPFNMAGQSYALKFDPYQGSGATKPWCGIEIQVIDAANFILDDIVYDVVMSPAATDASYIIRGPFTGTQMQIIIYNDDTVDMFYEISLNANSTPLFSHLLRTLNYNSIMAGFNLPPNADTLTGILGSAYRSALAAGSNDTYVLPPMPGQVTIGVRSVTPADPIAVEVAPYDFQTGFTGVSNGVSGRAQTDANGNANLTTLFPRNPMQIVFINKGSAATDYVWTAVADVTGA